MALAAIAADAEAWSTAPAEAAEPGRRHRLIWAGVVELVVISVVGLGLSVFVLMRHPAAPTQPPAAKPAPSSTTTTGRPPGAKGHLALLSAGDDTFFAKVRADGIPVGEGDENEADTVVSAYAVCGQMRSNQWGIEQEASRMFKLFADDTGYTSDQMHTFVTDAVGQYCPELHK